jgi:hypothetical protein
MEKMPRAPQRNAPHHQRPVSFVDQQDLEDFRMAEMKTPERQDGLGQIGSLIHGQQRHLGRLAGDRLQNGGRLHFAGSDGKLRMAAQRIDEQLRLHAVGIGDKNSDGI